MVNDIKQLMRDNVAAPPPDHLDLDALLATGHRRVRARRALTVGGTAVLVVAVVAATAVGLPRGTEHATANHPPAPAAPTIRLSAAAPAVEDRDYRVLTSVRNLNLNRDNGEYFDGVTDDGLVLFRDGPHITQSSPPTQRLALMDPRGDTKDWLPDPGLGQRQVWPVQLDRDRLVLLSLGGALDASLEAHVFDRATRQWATIEWPSLPQMDSPRAVMGPDGRLYVRVPATQGGPPPGGWPTDSSGEADDSDAEGDTFHLWSVSLADSADVRDEGMTVGDLVFTRSSMVWTDSTNGAPGQVHVRDLATGEEHSFDPHPGDKCNLLSFGATVDRVVMSEYCGTYADGVRDDRVQILSASGEQVVTIQDSSIDGALAGPTNNVVMVTSHQPGQEGTFLYDLTTDRFLRVSDRVSSYGVWAEAPDGEFSWSTPLNGRRGQVQWLGELMR